VEAGATKEDARGVKREERRGEKGKEGGRCSRHAEV